MILLLVSFIPPYTSTATSTASNSKQIPDSVAAAWKEIFREHGGLSTGEQADEYWRALSRSSRFQQETWS